MTGDAVQRRERDDAREGALELADVRLDALGDRGQDVDVRRPGAVALRLLAQDRDPGLQIGRLDVRDQAPLEPRTEPFLEGVDLLRRPVGRQDNLSAGLVHAVEGVEKLFLDALFPGEELDVVDQQNVVRPVPRLELVETFVLQMGDEIVHEGLAREVPRAERGGLGREVVGDRLQQVGFPQARRAVDEQRVVGLRRRLGHRERRGVREPVRRADHEVVERVLAGERVRGVRDACAVGRRGHRLGRLRAAGPCPTSARSRAAAGASTR